MSATQRTTGKRFAFKAKIIAALVILVVASFALVAAFAGGFATGTVLTQSAQREACAGLDGSWNEERSVCVERQAAQAPATTALAYRCGDGTGFTVETVSSTMVRLIGQDGDARELTWEDPAGAIAIYEDGPVSLTLVGPEAQYEDRSRGTSVLCTL